MDDKFMKSIAIIGGGVAGMEAAAKLSKQGFAVTIIEKEDEVGGRLNQWHALFPHRKPSAELRSVLIREISSRVNLITNAHINEIERNDDGFAIKINNNRLVTASVVLLTTGFDIFEAERKEEYGYGIYENVITSVELEQMFRSGKPIVNAQGRIPSRVGFIHCVGSRDEKAGNPHCSKVCCVTAVKQAIEVKEMFPASEVFLFYMDLRMFGRHFEELYKEAQFKHGIQFMRARLSEAFENPDGSVQIRIEDTLLSKPLKMSLDLLVLMVGIQPQKKKGNLVDMMKLERDADGFIKLEDSYSPHKTNIPGLFCAGGVTGPKTIEETLAEARAVTVEISGYLKNIENYAGQEQFVIEL
ncbi:MAG TPA: FAD-dependent oxidoreductase [Bacteroidales bacterium]|jgi:heterodisulfide reductase subunit A|nr:FAD-dependent oxidoreductase [Bacteroidales bacterium]